MTNQLFAFNAGTYRATWWRALTLVGRGAVAGRFPPVAFLGPSLPPLRRAFFKRARMSRVPWHAFGDRQRRGHLVTASVPDDQADTDLKATQVLLQRLVRKLKPAGDYSTTIVRDTGHPEVYFAFEDEADARKLAVFVKAKRTDSHPGWATQRAFQLDGAMVATLAASLPAPKAHRNEPLSDGLPLARRVRRGARTPSTRSD